MKKILLILSSFAILSSDQRPKIALVLSGGGAKGIAQIPTMQLIDSLNIPIDFIVGTSMGAITGAMYAMGYSSDEIEKEAFTADWDLAFSNNKHRRDLYFFQKIDYDKYKIEFKLSGIAPQPPIALVSGHNTYINLNHATGVYETVNNFDNFFIPFRCNAVDLLSGNEIIFKKGSLSKALRASSSIPSIFSPVKDNELLLVDGGVINNFPADIANMLGADIIIGINVSLSKKNMGDINTFFDVLSQSILLNGFKKRLNNLHYTDVLIEPDVSLESTLGFDLETLTNLYNAGYKAAQNKLTKLIKIKESLNLNQPLSINISSILSDMFTVNKITIHSKDNIPVDDILENKNFLHNISKDNFLNFILDLRRTNKYINVHYKLYDNTNGYDLHLYLEKMPEIIINDVIVKGNQKLSISFIKDIIDVKSGDYLDLNHLRKNIDNAYNLDYFESIRYELKNIGQNTDLIIIVDESTKNKMKLSGEWHSYYKLIGDVKFDFINKPLKKFRLTSQLRFGNTIAENHINIFYIKNFNYLSKFIPLIKLSTTKNQVLFYNLDNSQTEQNIYNRDYSFNTIISLKQYGFIDFGFHNQKIKYQNTYDGENLNYYSLDINIDQIDNLLYPRSGFLYDLSFEQSSEDYNYYLSSFKFDHYIPFSSNTRLKVYGDALFSDLESLGNNELILKSINYIPYDRTLSFSQYDLFVNELTSYGIEFNIDYKNSLTFRLLYNIINHAEFKHSETSLNNTGSYGFGIRVQSILGPFNFMWTHSDDMLFDKEMDNYFFSLGIDY